MQLSKRIASIKPSPTLALNAKAKELAQKGVKVYNFAVGEPDFPTPPAIVDATVAAIKGGKTKYGPAGGSLALREAICSKLANDNGLNYKPSEIAVGIGAKEVLFHLFMATINEGDEVIFPAPYWVSYTAQIEACGGKSVVIPMPENLSGPKLTPEMIDAHVTPKTRAVVLTSPNNPAGYVLKATELRALAEYLKNRDFWIISDEIYEYMAFDAPHVSLLQCEPSLKDRFILVNGLSKAYAMTGFRVGYAAGPEKVIKLVQSLESHSSTCLPPFIEEGALAALRGGRELMREQIKLLKDRRDLAMREIGKIPGIGVIPPEGAFYIYIDIRHLLAKTTRFRALDSLAFSEELLERHHVAMVPGEAFGTKGFLRLSYAVNNSDLIEGIAKLGQALRELS